VTGSIAPNYSRNTDDAQARGQFTGADSALHSLFSHLEQKELGITMRFTYPFSPDMTLQVYAQPFISKGTYSNTRELSATPRADAYDSRYQGFADSTIQLDPGFDFMQFRSNVVFRWEYRPGTALFVVWTSGRSQYSSQEGTNNFRGDMNELFNLSPNNTFLVKMSYWINR